MPNHKIASRDGELSKVYIKQIIKKMGKTVSLTSNRSLFLSAELEGKIFALGGK